MAFTAPYFNNSMVGIPQIGADVDVLAIDATQKFAIGTRFTRQDGNVYAYGYSSAGAVRGKVMASTFASSSLTLSSNVVIAPASAVAVAGDTMKPGAIGSTYIEITLAAVTANMFAGGYLTVGTGTGLGQSFRIKTNTATGNPATGNIRIQFYEPITVAFDATSDVNIVGNPFSDVIVADGTNYVIAGVSVSTTTAAKPYGWFLVRGIANCLQDDTTTALAAGKGIQLSAAVAGAVSLWGNAATSVANLQGLRYLGECLGISANTGYAICKFILG
jgi:hypothetical protein